MMNNRDNWNFRQESERKEIRNGSFDVCCVRVTFEIGHEASIRTKRIPEGFTHDWEVFVRGSDNTDISHFVEKVVFHLHDTFLKPKRVVKEPPYSVKESGYAGFKLPIDIYFRTQDEPKKVRFIYDLELQPSGPTISNVIREKYVFRNPDEDLRRRLIRGGGVGVVGSESGGHTTPNDKPNVSSANANVNDDSANAKQALPSSGGKSKPSSDSTKKHKTKEHRPEEPRVSNPFHELFGPPIKTNKVSPDPKKTSQPSPKVSPVSKPSKPPEKTSSDKQLSSSSKSSKHSGQKDSRESSDRSSSAKEEKKERSKDREKHKEKPPKRPSSPPKRQPSPPKLQPSSQPQPKPPKEEVKKVAQDEPKGKSDSKPTSDTSKSEKEKKKKDKKSRDEKPKKDKHKEHESKSSEKAEKSEKPIKESKEKEKESAKKQEKDGSKEIEKPKEKEKSSADGDKEHGRHKHKKKEKNKREDGSKEKDKSSKKDKGSSSSENKKTGDTKDRDRNGVVVEATKRHPHSPSLSPPPPDLPHEKPTPSPEKIAPQQSSKEKPKRPLTKLLAELTGNGSSDSDLSPPSPDDDSLDLPAPLLTKSTPPVENSAAKQEPVAKSEPVNNVSSNTHSNDKLDSAKSKSESIIQEKNSLNKDNSKQKDKSASKKSKEKKDTSGNTKDDGIKAEKESSKKRKRKSSSKAKEESDLGAPSSKAAKLELEQIKADEKDNSEAVGQKKVAPLEVAKDEEPPPVVTRDSDLSITAPVCEPEETPSVSEPIPSSPPTTLFSPDYVSQLKDLQRKIMTLEDNAELQRVVQVIAETGQYEITKKTFDFDLCALDRSTVKRLQDFFTTS